MNDIHRTGVASVLKSLVVFPGLPRLDGVFVDLTALILYRCAPSAPFLWDEFSN
jgi:hypothetical protein